MQDFKNIVDKGGNVAVDQIGSLIYNEVMKGVDAETYEIVCGRSVRKKKLPPSSPQIAKQSRKR